MRSAAEYQVIAPGVFYWEVYAPSVKADLSCCALATPDGLVFIDPIPLDAEPAAELSEVGPAAAIVLTNGNHPRAAEAYREQWKAPILAHREAVPELGIAIDQEIDDGALIAGGLQVVTLPGAGAGEIALVSPRRSVHLGDAVIHCEPYGFSMLPEKYCCDAKSLRVSLQKLLRFEFDLLTFAHGHPLAQQAKQRLAQLVS